MNPTLHSRYLASLFLLFGVSVSGQDLEAPVAVNPTDFDLDKNGLWTKAEEDAMHLHQFSSYYRDADGDKNGIITAEEEKKFLDKKRKNADAAKKNLANYGRLPSYPAPFDRVATTVELKSDKEEYLPLGGIQLRRSLKDVDPKRLSAKVKNSKDEYKKSLAKAKPAEFGFARNDLTGDDSWIARGVLAYPFDWQLPDGSGGYIIPSFQFDRVTHTKAGASEIDTLVFGTTAVWLPEDILGPDDDLEIRVGANYATDSQFDPTILGGSIDFEPTFAIPWLANDEIQDLPDPIPLSYRTRQFLRLEGGHADEAVKFPDGGYLRGGGVAGIDFLVKGFDRLVISADYQYLFDFLDGVDDFHNFRPSVRWNLDDIGHVTLEGAYEYGLISLSHQEVDLWSVTLGIRF